MDELNETKKRIRTLDQAINGMIVFCMGVGVGVIIILTMSIIVLT